MCKTIYLINFLIVILPFLSAQEKEKTEVKIHLSEVEYIYELANYTEDSTFLAAYNWTRKNYHPETSDFLTVLLSILFEQNPKQYLSHYFITSKLTKIQFTSTNDEVILLLREEIRHAKQKTIEVLKKRIESMYKSNSFFYDLFDDTQVEIMEMGQKDTDTYLVSINKKVNKDRLIKLLQTRIDFGFSETFDISEIWDNLQMADSKIKEILISENKLDKRHSAKENPLFSILNPSVLHDGKLIRGALIGTSQIKDTSSINDYLAIPAIKNLFPTNLLFMWKSKPDNYSKEYLQLFAIKIANKNRAFALNGDFITEAKAVETEYGVRISLSMDDEGAKIWARITKENIGKQIAIVLNHKVYSNPVVQSEISGGVTEISGNFTMEEAQTMANLLNAGSTPSILVNVINSK